MSRKEIRSVHTRASYYPSLLAMIYCLVIGTIHINDVDSFGQTWG